MASDMRMDLSGLLRGLDEYQQKMLYAVETAGRVGAAQMEQYAKLNRPWQDRTSFARMSISGKVERRGFGVRVLLTGGMYYFVYLEYAHEKKWAILWPTIRKLGPEILSQLGRLRLG